MKRFIICALLLLTISSNYLICSAYEPPKPVSSNQTVYGSESEDDNISDSSDDLSDDIDGSIAQAIDQAINAAINAAIQGLF